MKIYTNTIKEAKLGILTLAIPKDYKKAVGLALTLKEQSHFLPISVAVSPETEAMIMPYKYLFDQVIIQRTDLKGFEQKLYLDEYSPYENTFFFDSDILIIKDIMPIINKWAGNAYAVRGHLSVEGVSSFGLDRGFVLGVIKKDEFVVIDGAGHAYFEKPACQIVFDKAREILSQYDVYQAKRFADEDAIGIAMTVLDIKPMKNNGFLGSPWCAINNSFEIDTDKADCSYEDLILGKVSPYVVHFPTFAYPFTYARELTKTFNRHGIKMKNLWMQALKEFLTLRFYWPINSARRKIIKKIFS